MEYLKVVQKGNKYFGKYPFKGIPKKYFEMTKELNTDSEVRKINTIKISEGILKINGYIYIQRVNFDKKSKVKIQAKLVNIINKRELEVNIENIKMAQLTQKFGIRAIDHKLKNRLYNYDWAGYNIDIDLNDPEILELGSGDI